jgi:hypothetical protein
LVSICPTCSRVGVLNEIERVLEREAREGGTDILIPVTIDDFVFSDWKPSRDDIAAQVRSRVITTIPNNDIANVEFQKELEKVVQMLKKRT